MDWQYETTHEKLARLRRSLAQASDELIDAEAELADRMAEVHAFEFEFESKVGHLIDKLAEIEAEVNEFLMRIRSLRNEQHFGLGYRSVEEQYHRTWQAPPKSAPLPPPQPLPPATEDEIKKLYRQLARRCHPDLASNESDRAIRTEKMQAINDAYAARSMVELVALAQELGDKRQGSVAHSGGTDADMIKVLENELSRCRRRLNEIQMKLRNFHNRPSVDVSIQVKLARHRGQDLFADMAAELTRKINRLTVERDMIKAQFDSLDDGQQKTIRPR